MSPANLLRWLGAAVLVTAAPAVAEEPGTRQASPAQVDQGCYDLSGGGPAYQRLVESYSSEQVVPGLYRELQVVQADRGVVYGNLALAGLSCADATYELVVHAAEPVDGVFRLLGRASVRGDGESRLVRLDLVLRGYAHQAVRAQARVLDAAGNVRDLGRDQGIASDAALVWAVADGLPEPAADGRSWD